MVVPRSCDKTTQPKRPLREGGSLTTIRTIKGSPPLSLFRIDIRHQRSVDTGRHASPISATASRPRIGRAENCIRPSCTRALLRPQHACSRFEHHRLNPAERAFSPADILMCTFSVPFTPLQSFSGKWVFGEVLCKLFPFSQVRTRTRTTCFAMQSTYIHVFSL